MPLRLKFDLEAARKAIVEFIRSEVKGAGAEGVVVGLSGGVDSSTTAFLCCEALGSENVLGLIMPDSEVTPKEDVRDAELVAELLGMETKVIDIAPIVRSLISSNPLYDPSDIVAEGNVRARVRMVLLYYAANRLRKLVCGTGDRSELLIGYFCYDSATRALTTEGLKSYHELKPGDIVFSLNLKTGAVEEVPVRAVYVFDYDGPMVRFNGRRTDLLVTPNHRMLVARGSGGLGFILAAELAGKGRFSLPIPKPWRGTRSAPDYLDVSLIFDQSQLHRNANRIPDKLPIGPFLYLMGLYIGNGTCSTYAAKTIRRTTLSRAQFLPLARDGGGRFTIPPDEYRSETPVTYEAYAVYFSIPKGGKARGKLEATLKTLGIPYKCYANFIRVNSRALYEVLKLCGTRADDKRIPRWVLSYPADKLTWLFNGLIDSDGWSNQCYQTTSYKLALNIVELCAKLGMHATIMTKGPKAVKHYGKVIRSKQSYVVSITRKIKATTLYERDVSIVHYTGIVWCPDVPPHHNLLVERNGKFAFCGNTKYGDGAVDILPLACLYKTQVRELAAHLGVPKRIVTKPSSPRLWPGQTAEDELGMSYEAIDLALYALYDLKLSVEEAAKITGLKREVVERVRAMVESSEHKRRLPRAPQPIRATLERAATIAWESE